MVIRLVFRVEVSATGFGHNFFTIMQVTLARYKLTGAYRLFYLD
jgi:hypothetical protein